MFLLRYDCFPRSPYYSLQSGVKPKHLEDICFVLNGQLYTFSGFYSLLLRAAPGLGWTLLLCVLRPFSDATIQKCFYRSEKEVQLKIKFGFKLRFLSSNRIFRANGKSIIYEGNMEKWLRTHRSIFISMHLPKA